MVYLCRKILLKNGENMRKVIILLLLLLFFSGGKVFCKQLTLEEAITAGISNNPSIQAERAKIGISEAQIKTAGLRTNPRLVLDASIADKSYKGGIEQTIELGGKIKKRVNIAKNQKEVTLQEIATSIIDLRAQIRTAYIQLYSAQEKLKTANEILKITNSMTDIAQKREIAGDIAKLDVLQAQIAEINTKSEIETAKLEKSKAINNLSFYLGEFLSDDIELQKPEINSDYGKSKADYKTVEEVLIQEAKNNRPELKRMAKLLEQNKNLEKLAIATAVPDLTVAVGPNIMIENTDNGEVTHFCVYSTVAMDLPVFNHGQAALKQAKAERVKIEKDLQTEENRVVLEVKNAYASVVKTAEVLRIYENELLPKSKEVLSKSEMSFKEGKSNILMLLTSQEAYTKAQNGYIDAISNYQTSLSDLERALGANNEEL